MKPRLYLDGCSYVWGAGLDPQYNLQSLLSKEFDVINKSRGGKSNLAMAMDLHQSAKDCDIVVVGWTYATRFYLQYAGVDLDFFPTNTKTLHPIPGNQCDIDLIEDAYYDFHKYFYTLYSEPFIGQLSDMLIDSSWTLCTNRTAKTIFFSWESRNTNIDLYVPFLPPKYLLPCQHMNQQGTEYLYQNLRRMIDE